METQTLEDELLALEQRYWQAIQEGDVATAASLTDYPCIVAGSRGVMAVDRESFERMMGSSNRTLHSFSLADPTVRRLGDDVAVIAYRLHEDVSIDGKRVSLDASDSSTWVRRDGRWACAVHTETPADKPERR